MLQFHNAHDAAIWAMVEWSHPNCQDGGNWEKKGWWMIEPGQTAVVYGGDHHFNRYWYYYAHSSAGRQWGGSYSETVPPRSFQWCESTASSDSRTVGMGQIDVSATAAKHTLNFS
jgi:uncharacterized membrane protein